LAIIFSEWISSPWRSGKFKKAAALAPRDYDASHNLGEFYVRSNKVPEAIPFLERAAAD